MRRIETPLVRASISIEHLDADKVVGRDYRRRRWGCWKGSRDMCGRRCGGGRCWSKDGRRKTKIHPLATYAER